MTLKLSLIIPVRNEKDNIAKTCEVITACLESHRVDFEFIIINDHSTDQTARVLRELTKKYSNMKTLESDPPYGFGLAVRKGLDAYSGDAACVIMGDLSDLPEDIVKYYRELESGALCVFGSRFMPGSAVRDYPPFKWIVNRISNRLIQLLFWINHNDISNAFKCYRREVIDGIRPLTSQHFNLTVEMPLKAIVRGYPYTKVPVSWMGRKKGVSKLKFREMGSRYFQTVLHIFIEHLSRRGLGRSS